MAEGGDLSQTVLGASEEFYDFNCSTCEEDGVCKEAHQYCESCKLYYCKKCLADHNRFPALRGHVITDVTNLPQTASQKTHSSTMSSQASHLEQCKHHPEEMIKMYCGKHDLVCCTVCIALDHRDCNDIHYILNVANGIRTRQEYTDYVEEIADVRSEYEETKQSILTERKKLSDIKTEIIAEINEYKRELVARIDELERKSIENVNGRFKEITERMDLTLDQVNELLEKVTKSERDIKHVSEAMLFINMKTMRLIEKEAKEIDKRIEHFEGLSFSLDTCVKDVLDDSDGLVTPNHPIKVLVKKRYDIALNDYIKYSAGDSCILDDGTIVVTFDNTLKRLDRSYGNLSSIFLNGECYGVCKTSRPKELAVTIRDMELVQYVKYNDKTMTLTNTFTVGAPCKGIYCKDAYLFVACGGGDVDTVTGHIRQYSMNGDLICTIDTDKTGRRIFTSPRFMAFNSITNDIYVTDRDNGIIVLGKDGHVESHSYNSFLENGLSICISAKNILVYGCDTYNIQQYDEKFRYVGTVLNFTNKKHSPTCILLDVSRRQLIVCFEEHCKIHVYDVEC